MKKKDNSNLFTKTDPMVINGQLSFKPNHIYRDREYKTTIYIPICNYHHCEMSKKIVNGMERFFCKDCKK